MKRIYLILFGLAVISVLLVAACTQHLPIVGFAIINDNGDRLIDTELFSLPPLIPQDAELEFNARYSDWISKNVNFYFTSGYMMPGDEAYFDFFGNADVARKVDDEWRIRFQLTKRDENWQRVDTISEQIHNVKEVLADDFRFSVNLPKDEDVPYLLSLEILVGTEVRETLLTAIYVPQQEINAAIRTDKQTYKPSENLILTIYNKDGPAIDVPGEILLERSINGVWQPSNLGAGVKQHFLHIYPGWSYEQTIPLGNLIAGDYRITKTVSGLGTGLEQELTVTFTVVK